MAETHPYRNRVTGIIQNVPDDAAAVFGDQFERLPDDYEQTLAEVEVAEAEVKAAPRRGTAAAKAKAHLNRASKAAEKIETPTVAPTEVENPNVD